MSAPTQSDAPTHVQPSGHSQASAQPLSAFQTTLVRSGDEWERAGQAEWDRSALPNLSKADSP